jgi:hypothetical protein
MLLTGAQKGVQSSYAALQQRRENEIVEEANVSSYSNPAMGAPPEAAAPGSDRQEPAPAMFAALFRRGLANAALAHRYGMAMAAQYGDEALETAKNALRLGPAAPGMFLFDIAHQAIHGYVETHNRIMDLTFEQGAAVLETARDGSESAARIATGMAAMLQQTVVRSVAAQKIALDFAAQQSRIATGAAKKQFGIAGTPAEAAADTIQRGVDALVEAQKEMLELAAKPLKMTRAEA